MLFAVRASDPLLVLLVALALDLLMGEMPAVWRIVPHPVMWVGNSIAWLDRRLNRAQRSDAVRRARGILCVAALTLAAAASGFVLHRALGVPRFGWVIEALVVAILLAQKSLFDHVARVGEALQHKGLLGGREAVKHIVGRDPDSLDEHGVARAAIESLAENLNDGVVAPVLWYAVLGLPGLFFYKTANTLDSMIGHRSPRHLQFGWAAARLDDVLNLVPARLTALLLSVAALALPQASARNAVTTMLRDGSKHRSPNAGWPEAAAAGALGLALGGPKRYGGALVADPWLGQGRARATPNDVTLALRLYLVACLVQAALVLTAFAALRFA
ncbi:MAG TPA: adenosylcobinamide-phosphate synthase CbiB [Stellaceae bacterium]|nr:adenosylcobinamide-phosphate synthase CbiB [Stellaceae bacterium]